MFQPLAVQVQNMPLSYLCDSMCDRSTAGWLKQQINALNLTILNVGVGLANLHIWRHLFSNLQEVKGLLKTVFQTQESLGAAFG